MVKTSKNMQKQGICWSCLSEQNTTIFRETNEDTIVIVKAGHQVLSALLVAYSALLFWIAYSLGVVPSQDSSHYQNYYMFSRGSQPKPLFPTVTGRGTFGLLLLRDFFANHAMNVLEAFQRNGSFDSNRHPKNSHLWPVGTCKRFILNMRKSLEKNDQSFNDFTWKSKTAL